MQYTPRIKTDAMIDPQRKPRFTRRQDELILDMLKLRDEGKTFLQIARELGCTMGMVAGSLRRVDQDEVL